MWRCFACNAAGSAQDLFSRLTTGQGLAGDKVPSQEEIEALTDGYFPTCSVEYIERCAEVVFEPKGRKGLSYWTNTRGFPVSLIREYRLGYDPLYDAVVIPKFSHVNGGLMSAKLRMIEYQEQRPKYIYARGGLDNSLYYKPIPLKPDPAFQPKDVLYVEGEIDALSGLILAPGRFDIFASTGAQNRNLTSVREMFAEHAQKYENVYILFDSDAEGKRGAEALSEFFDPEKTYVIKELPGAKDLNELLKIYPVPEASAKFAQVLEISKPKQKKLVKPMVDARQRFLDHFLKGEHIWTSTGYEAIDTLCGGLTEGVTVLTAIPGSGKSTLAAGIAANVALKSQIPVLIGSLETAFPEQCCSKIVSFVNHRNVELVRPNADELEAYFDKLVDAQTFYWMDHRGRIDLDRLVRRVVDAYTKDGVRFVVLDHLQVLIDETDLQQVTLTMAKLHEIMDSCPELKILLVVQPKRRLDEGLPLSMRDLKGGSTIEDNASCILAIDTYKAQKILRLLKLRSDGIMTPEQSYVRMNFDKEKYEYQWGKVVTPQEDLEQDEELMNENILF